MLKRLSRILSLVLSLCLIFEQTRFTQVAAQLDIASHLAGLHSSFVQGKFRPLHLRYLQYDPQDNYFRLLLDKGDTKNPTSTEVETTTKELLNYFFVGISLPNDAFWVNLRPDSPDNIIDPLVAQTEVGKILLEADLQLKKDTARMTSPETSEGKDYWNKLYEKAGELFGSENITIPTLTRPWIVPDEIIVGESIGSAYIYKATLKVMLEQDYLKDNAVYSFKDERLKALNEYSSQIIRETIIPKLTKEVNTSKRYAPLRQVFYSLILAQWFKARQQGKNNLYSRHIDSKDLSNLFAHTPYSVDTYFKSYKDNFEQGEYNIKEPAYTSYGQVIRSYFSGGIFLKQMSPDGPIGATSSGNRVTYAPARSNVPMGKHVVAMRIKGFAGEMFVLRDQDIGLTPIINDLVLVLGREGVAADELKQYELQILKVAGKIRDAQIQAGGMRKVEVNIEEKDKIIPGITNLSPGVLGMLGMGGGEQKVGYNGKGIEGGSLSSSTAQPGRTPSVIVPLEMSGQEESRHKIGYVVNYYRIEGQEKNTVWFSQMSGVPKEVTFINIGRDGKQFITSGLATCSALFYIVHSREGLFVFPLHLPITGDFFEKFNQIIISKISEKFHSISDISVIIIPGLLINTDKAQEQAKMVREKISEELIARRLFVPAAIFYCIIVNVQSRDWLDRAVEVNVRDKEIKIAMVHYNTYDSFPQKMKIFSLQLPIIESSRNEQTSVAKRGKLRDEEKVLNKTEKLVQPSVTTPVSAAATLSQSVEPDGATGASNKGGIDFRFLPIVTQAISNLQTGVNGVSLTRLKNINLGSEWQEIDRLVNSGMTPSTERIKEFVQAAAMQDDAGSDISKVVSCIADIFRLEEERCESSEPALKDILIVLESGRNSQELKEIFIDHNI